MYGHKYGQKLVDAAQNREEQECAKEKAKLDNARKLRGIYFIEPDDKDCSEILKNARRTLGRPMGPVMACKRMGYPSIVKVMAKPKIGDHKRSKTKYC